MAHPASGVVTTTRMDLACARGARVMPTVDCMRHFDADIAAHRLAITGCGFEFCRAFVPLWDYLDLVLVLDLVVLDV